MKNSKQIEPLNIVKAVEEGDLEKVKTLLDEGADVNQINSSGQTILIIAAQKGYDDMLELLIKRGVNLDLEDNSIALTLVAKNNLSKSAKLLLEKKADVNCRAKERKSTPLMFAAYQGHLSMAETLLESKADPNLANKDGRTALEFASFTNKSAMVDLLLEKKAGAEKVEQKEGGALKIAAKNGNRQIIKSLLKHGAHITDDISGKLSLPVMAAMQKDDEMMELLIKSKANLDQLDDKGRTALIIASENGNVKMAQMLLKAGAKHELRGQVRFIKYKSSPTLSSSIL